MSAPVKIAGFLAAVAAVFGAALLAGRVVGPTGGGATKPTEMREAREPEAPIGFGGHAGH